MRLSHQEAQALVSARLDGPLDPIAERELNAHLATCDSCRAFNASVHRLATGLQQLPYLPPSPAVTRAVLEHISAPASPWAWLGRAWSARALPTVAAVATAMIIVFTGTFAALRVLDDRDNPAQIPASTESTSELAALPSGDATETAVARQETEAATDLPEETTEPAADLPETEVPATEPGDSTSESATDTEPETTAVPTDQAAEPTTDDAALSGLAATELPTEAPAPTEEPTAEPTEEPVPTEAPPATEGPTEQPATESAPGDDETIGPPPTSTGESSFFIQQGGTPSSDETVTEEPVATDVPANTPTEEPTQEPSPTPVPTDVPTEAPTEVPTEVPTEEPTPTPVPTEEPTEVPTEEPTPTPVPTEEPTEVPTEAATPTPMPTDVPTEAPTPTPVPTEEPEPTVVPIEQVDGTDDGVESAQPTDESDGTGGQSTLPAGNDSGDDDGDDGGDDEGGDGGDDGQTIGPSGPDNSGQGNAGDDGNGDSTGPGDGENGDDSGDGQTIEQDGETTPVDTVDDGNDQGGGGADPGDTRDGQDLAAAPVYTDAGSVPVAGDRFGVSAEGDLIFSTNPGRASLEANGLAAEGFDAGNGQIVRVCSASACVDASAGSATGSQTDTPLGWLGDELIYERMNGETNPIEYRAIRFVPGSLDVADDRLIGGGGSELESIIRPYPVNGTLLVPARGAWVRLSPAAMEVLDGNPYGTGMSFYRVHPEANAIAYLAEGAVQVASLDSPGSPYASVPLTGADFDLSPDGQMIAIISGDGIEIYDLGGTLLGRFSNNEGLALAGIAWIPEGLLFVDASSGQIRILPT